MKHHSQRQSGSRQSMPAASYTPESPSASRVSSISSHSSLRGSSPRLQRQTTSSHASLSTGSGSTRQLSSLGQSFHTTQSRSQSRLPQRHRQHMVAFSSKVNSSQQQHHHQQQMRAFALFSYQDRIPQIEHTSFISKGATLIGDVQVGHNVAILPGAIIRADNSPIIIGDGSNVQENAVVHTDPGIEVRIGKNVTIGHLAMLHGCTIDDNTIIGMTATVMNNAKIGKNCIIGAGALVTENKVIPDNSLVVGSPAKVIRSTTDADMAMIQATAKAYTSKIDFFRDKRELTLAECTIKH